MFEQSADDQLLDTYAKRQDPLAFRVLVDRYGAMVFSTARRVTADAALAEDIAQEVFLELARQAAAIHGSLGAWLHRVAYNRALDANRRRATRRRHEAEAVEHKQRLASEAGWDDLGPIIDAAIEDLPDEQRQPLVQHFLLGRTQDDIAAELGVNPTTVSRRIQRGLKKVRARMRKEGLIVGAAALAAMLGRAGAEAAPLTVTANLSKIGLAGIGGVGAGTSLTAVGAGTVASLVVAALLVLSAGVGIAAWITAAPPPPAVSGVRTAALPGAAVHPRVGPVVGYFEGEPVHAGDLLLPLGWPDDAPPQLDHAPTALPMLESAAHDELLRRALVQQAAAALTPRQWQTLQAGRAEVRDALVQAHGSGDAGRANRALQQTTGWSLDDAVQRQVEDDLALQHLAGLGPVPIPHGAADDRTPRSRQQVLTRLRGAAFSSMRTNLEDQALARSSYTPAATMARETWRWLAGDRDATSPPVNLETAVVLLGAAAREAMDLPLAEPAQPAQDVHFRAEPLPAAWLTAGQVQRLTDLADADAGSSRSPGRLVTVNTGVPMNVGWGPDRSGPQVYAGARLRRPTPGMAPAIDLIVRVDGREPVLMTLDSIDRTEWLLLDLGTLDLTGDGQVERILVLARVVPAGPHQP